LTFANPIFLWALLSLLPLIAIYLLKVRPNRKPATAYFLWEDIFQQKRANSLFQRLRDLFSLLLMLAAFLAVVLALAKPVFNADSQKDLLLVIDNTASMNAKEPLAGTRLDSAKKTAREIVESLNGSQRCSIATLSDRIRYVSNMTDSPRELLEAINGIQPTELPCQLGALAEFEPAKKTVEPVKETEETEEANEKDGADETDNTVVAKDVAPSHRVILISDGLVGDIPETVEFIRMGEKSSGNAGIVACDLQRLPGQDRASVFFQLASSFNDAVEAEITLSQDNPDNIIKLIPVTIEPGVNKAVVFELEQAQAGRWYLNLEIDDAMPQDNQSFLVLHPVKPIPVQVFAKEKFFYENSVASFGQDGGLLKLVSSGGQMAIGHGAFEDVESVSDLLIFRPAGESSWWEEIGEEIEVKLPRAVDEDHPVIRHVDVTSIPFVGARRVTVPPAAEVLVEAEDETPLIWRMSKAGRSAVVVNLDPLDSNFYFSAWFPVMVYSSATHLAGRSEELKSTWTTGQVALLPGDDQQESKLTLPDGETETRDTPRTPLLEKTGFYEIENDSGTWQAACSLLSRAETMVDNREISDTAQPINRGRSPVGWLTVLAIVVVTVESILYQRRKVG